MRRTKRSVLIVVGTRPEAIKMMPVILAVKQSEHLTPVVISTGQHSELVAEVLGFVGITPDVTLQIRDDERTLNGLFSAVMRGLNSYVTETYGENPGAGAGAYNDHFPVATLVHGDTSSAAAAALASFHLHIPVGHVEAGLRTSNTLSPFPEELNRQLISRIAVAHFAPTPNNAENLLREGVALGRVLITGNTAIDALQLVAERKLPYGMPELEALEDDESRRVVVVTAHRRENWNGGIARIASAVRILAESHEDDLFVVSLHPNPAVADVFRAELTGLHNVIMVKPMRYGAFARLLERAYIAITDSGGIQEEAPALGTPVVVVRETTERQEGVDAGTVKLVGTHTADIVAVAGELLDNAEAHGRQAGRRNPYGDGYAAQRILAACEHIAYRGDAPQSLVTGFDRNVILRAAGYLEDPADVRHEEEVQMAHTLVGDLSDNA